VVQIPINRRSDHYFGTCAEWLGYFYFMLCGYQLIRRNWCHRFGQVDLLVLKNNTLISVEIKARRLPLREGDYAMLISRKQQMRLYQSSCYYFESYNKGKWQHLQFDILVIHPWRWPIHIKNVIYDMHLY
jgi:putative endonuclease